MSTTSSVGNPFGPENVRALRGSASRAAFARRVGVTPQTVYRWELPDGAREARRPRGTERARLENLSQTLGSISEPTEQSDGPAPRSAASVEEDLARVLPSLERVFHGDSRRGHGELVQLLAMQRDLSIGARARACFGIALCELVHQSDSRSALLAISPALNDANAGRLTPDVAAKVFSVAALLHAWPDAMVFDQGRVHAYGARVEALAGGTDHDASAIACLAALCSAMLVGDRELLDRAFTRLEEMRLHELPPLLKLHVEEFLTVQVFASKRFLPLQDYEAICEQAERRGYPLLLSRALSRLALCQLDRLNDPQAVLAILGRAKRACASGRVGPGLHQLLALRAEIEAQLRLGNTAQALLVLDEIEVASQEMGIPPLTALPMITRLLQLTAKNDALTALGARLRACSVPSLRPICQAYASYAEACALLVTSADPLATVAAFERAEEEAERWPYLLRDVLLYRIMAHAIAGQAEPGRVALRRAQRFVDAFPSAWLTAQLRRLEGGLLASMGQWSDARQLLESAVATFEIANDECDATVTRYVYLTLANACEGPQGEALLQARARLAGIGLAAPRGLDVAIERFKSSRREGEAPTSGSTSPPVTTLVVPLQRLSVRGAAPNLILRELVSVLSGLFVDREVSLEEIDSTGTVHPLFGKTNLDHKNLESAEFSDGAGRLLRVGIAGVLHEGQRAALNILITVASLALESATLRGFNERTDVNTTDERSPELPGFVAASPAMRKLRAELVRLAGSQATVIITGESGVGKEIVARAIHDLSERSGKPYVAFNCATVPRDLFEGQLFGYRRGAFTGAVGNHPGVIRAAAGGTLFLDEIGELPLDIQPKLLRFLENAEVFPLGEPRPLRVDVRVLAATHRDLAALVREGKFREDLYYRLQVVPVYVAPLRERREDIPVLARHFLKTLTRRGEPAVLAPDAISALIAHRWPGNVRELRNVIERTLAFSPEASVLRAAQLPITNE